MSKPLFKQFCLPRSGSNLLKALIEKNYEAEILINKMIWKHGIYQISFFDNQTTELNLDVLVTVKNPFAQLYSLWKLSQEDGQDSVKMRYDSFDDFLTNPYVHTQTLGDYKSPEFKFKNPIEYYNTVNWHYTHLNLNFRKNYIFRYEDLIGNPEYQLEQFSKVSKIKRISVDFYFPESKMNRLWDGQTNYESGEKTNDVQFYKNKEYFNHYSSEMIDFVRDNIDDELINMLNYNKLMEM